MTAPAHKPLRIFCSYSHRDEEHLNDLRDWLRGLERQRLVEWWHDREISPGWEWEEAIDKNLRNADVILLLVSPAFMGSDYVYEKEIGRAIEKHERGEARVIPIIVRPSDWEWPPLNKLQAIPRDAKPITTWPNQDEAWLDVVRGVRRAVEELMVERRERAAKERYRKAVEEAWADNHVSDADAERLDTLRSELGLAMDTAADVEREVMGESKKAILERQAQAAREKEGIERRKRSNEWYAEARRLHRARNWQAVVDVFEQIHAEDPNYSDEEGLLTSARKVLEDQALSQKVAATYDQGLLHVDAQEWQQALQCFEEIQRLRPDYKDTKMLLAQAQLKRTTITVENVDRIRFLRAIEHDKDVSQYEISPNGKLLASIIWKPRSDRHETPTDTIVRLWRVEDGQLVRMLKGHTDGEMSTPKFSPDGRLLAARSSVFSMFGSDSHTVELWKVDDGALVRTLQDTYDVAFSPDGRLLASVSPDPPDTVELRKVDDGALVRILKGHRSERQATLRFSPDGKVIACVVSYAKQEVLLWRVEDGTLVRAMEGVTELAFSPDGKSLAAKFTNDDTVLMWRVEDWALLRTFDVGASLSVTSMVFSPDGRLLASGTSNGTVQMWRVDDGELVHTWELGKMVDNLAFSPDGSLLAAGSYGNINVVPRILRVEDGTLVRTMEEGSRLAFSTSGLAFSPDGRLLISELGSTIKLWGIAETDHHP